MDNISNTSKKVTIVGDPAGNDPAGDDPAEDDPAEDKPTENDNKTNNTSDTADKKIPYTGEQSIAFAVIGGTVLIAVIAYIKYKQYKNI